MWQRQRQARADGKSNMPGNDKEGNDKGTNDSFEDAHDQQSDGWSPNLLFGRHWRLIVLSGFFTPGSEKPAQLDHTEH